MELEYVNGIIVWEDGVPHSFGVNKMAPSYELDDENYHTTSFKNDIYPKKWFQDTGYSYNPNDSFTRQMDNLSAYGFTILCNASSRITDQDDYYCFIITAPANPSDNVKEYLSSIYDPLQTLIQEKGAYFQGTAYLENGDYAWNNLVTSLEEYYDRLEIPKAKHY